MVYVKGWSAPPLRPARLLTLRHDIDGTKLNACLASLATIVGHASAVRLSSQDCVKTRGGNGGRDVLNPPRLTDTSTHGTPDNVKTREQQRGT